MRRVVRLSSLTGLLLLAFVVFGGASSGDSCSNGDTRGNIDQQRQQAVQQRADVYQSAASVAPPPRPVNFPLRKALVEFTNREDMLDHPWYVYILGDNGNTIGYYVAKSAPVNSCAFLSSTEQVWTGGQDGNASQVLTAPSLDGIYYGGSGSATGCDEWFLFDLATNALIKFRGLHFYVADQPLRIQADAIKVAAP